MQPRRQLLGAVLEAACERNELREDLDLELTVNMLIGAYYAQYLSGAPFGEEWAERLVDVTLRGLAHPG